MTIFCPSARAGLPPHGPRDDQKKSIVCKYGGRRIWAMVLALGLVDTLTLFLLAFSVTSSVLPGCYSTFWQLTFWRDVTCPWLCCIVSTKSNYSRSTHTPHSLVEQFRYLISRFLYVRLFALLWLAFFPYFPQSFDYNMVHVRAHIQPPTPRPRKSEMNRFLSASCRQTPDSVCITEEVWRITRNWHYDRRSSAKCVISLRLRA